MRKSKYEAKTRQYNLRYLTVYDLGMSLDDSFISDDRKALFRHNVFVTIMDDYVSVEPVDEPNDAEDVVRQLEKNGFNVKWYKLKHINHEK